MKVLAFIGLLVVVCAVVIVLGMSVCWLVDKLNNRRW